MFLLIWYVMDSNVQCASQFDNIQPFACKASRNWTNYIEAISVFNVHITREYTYTTSYQKHFKWTYVVESMDQRINECLQHSSYTCFISQFRIPHYTFRFKVYFFIFKYFFVWCHVPFYVQVSNELISSIFE